MDNILTNCLSCLFCLSLDVFLYIVSAADGPGLRKVLGDVTAGALVSITSNSTSTLMSRAILRYILWKSVLLVFNLHQLWIKF
jgi:hypothetical protein